MSPLTCSEWPPLYMLNTLLGSIEYDYTAYKHTRELRMECDIIVLQNTETESAQGIITDQGFATRQRDVNAFSRICDLRHGRTK